MKACADAGAAAGVVDLGVAEPDQRGAGARAAQTHGRRLAARARRARLRTLAIVRDRDLIFFRTRPARGATGTWRISSTRPRCITRIGSAAARFARVVLAGASARGAETADALRREPRRADRRQGRGARLPRHRGDARSDQRRRPSCSTRWRRPSASSSGSRSPDAPHQSLDPAVLQRARRARRRRRWSRSSCWRSRPGRSSASSGCRSTRPS